MVSLNHEALIARYERFRRKLAELDRKALALAKGGLVDAGGSDEFARLLEQIERVDCQLVEIERQLPQGYEYKPGSE